MIMTTKKEREKIGRGRERKRGERGRRLKIWKGKKDEVRNDHLRGLRMRGEGRGQKDKARI